MQTFTIDLDPPIKAAGGGKIAQIGLKEPTAKQVADAEKKLAGGGPAAFRLYQVALLQAASGLLEDDIRVLPFTIFRRAVDFVSSRIEADTDVPTEQAPQLEIALDPPLTSFGVTYAEISLREPTTGEVMRAEARLSGSTDPAAVRNYMIGLVTEVSGMPWAAVNELPVSTVNKGAAYVRGFLADGPAAGAG